MIHFNELCIRDNHLIIDVNVIFEDYYNDVYLDNIIIDNQDTYTNGFPSDNPIYSKTIDDVENKFTKKAVGQKHVRIVLDENDINLNDMLFVYVTTKGNPSPDTPCGLDKNTTLGVVVDMMPYYTKGMQYLGELGNNCSIPSGFMDFILRTKALELTMKTGNYSKSIEYFNGFKTGVVSPRGGCGCGNN